MIVCFAVSVFESYILSWIYEINSLRSQGVLRCGLGWAGICCVDQVGLKHAAILLPLPLFPPPYPSDKIMSIPSLCIQLFVLRQSLLVKPRLTSNSNPPASASPVTRTTDTHCYV